MGDANNNNNSSTIVLRLVCQALSQALYPINSVNPLNNLPLLQIGKLRPRNVRTFPVIHLVSGGTRPNSVIG